MVCIRNRGGPNGFGANFVASLSSEVINAIFAKSISSVKSLNSVHILFAQGQQPLKRSRKFSHSTSFLGKHTQGTSYIINVNLGKSHSTMNIITCVLEQNSVVLVTNMSTLAKRGHDFILSFLMKTYAITLFLFCCFLLA